MYDTFELLRRAAEERREHARRLQGGIDPADWEELLDRVEDHLDDDDRDGTAAPAPATPASLHTRRQTGLPLSLFATGTLGTALLQPAVDASGSGPQLVHCLAAGAALAGLGRAAMSEGSRATAL
ncbi:hypothetical protein ABT033_12385 [Streptomyces pharetrae]|uniref:hypothetical protein n=1 Tax=Streptomyces pharetrae TaxID=291370 RepID=UPI00335560BF